MTRTSVTRRRPSPALIVACLALAVSLSGVGYAASALPRNSVGAAQLKADAVASRNVKNGSLLAADFKGGQVPAGVPGPQGPKGNRGEQGPQGPAGPTAGPAGPFGPAAPLARRARPDVKVSRALVARAGSAAGSTCRRS